MLKRSLSLQFLGTGSQKSTLARATQSIALLIRSGYEVGQWLFDCGELTTHQIYALQRQRKNIADEQRVHDVILRPSRISKVFITHMHGDHIYGLPTLLSDAGISRTQGKSDVFAPIDIYGPPGLSQYLKTVFQLTDTKLNHPCIIHEMYKDENDPRLDTLSKADSILQYKDRRIQVDPLFPNANGFWDLVKSSLGNVQAGTIHHTIECFGYRFQSSLPNFMINDEEVKRRLQPLQEELQHYDITEGDVLQRLHHKQKVTLPSGTCLDPLDSSLSMVDQVERKEVAILGDTDNGCDLIPLIAGCDVLVHEATIIPTQREMRQRTMEEMEEQAKQMGHSTAGMAGRYARKVGAKQLVLTHLSSRYGVGSGYVETPDLKELRELAVMEYGSNNVVIARDFMKLAI